MLDRQFNATCILAVILLHQRDRVDYLQYTELDMGLLMEVCTRISFLLSDITVIVKMFMM